MQFHVMWVENGKMFRETILNIGSIEEEKKQADSLASELRRKDAKISDVKIYMADDMVLVYR